MTQDRFSVGVTIGGVHGGGYLELSPEGLTLRVGGLSSRLTGVAEIVGTDTDVIVVTTRWMLPWVAVRVPVSDGVKTGVATLPIWLRSVLVESLEAKGLRVVERSERFRGPLDI